MTQFSSTYGQLFCCNCPGGFAVSINCAHNGSSPIYISGISLRSYQWVVFIICMVFVVMIVVVSIVFCCRWNRLCGVSRRRVESVVHLRKMEENVTEICDTSFLDPSFSHEIPSCNTQMTDDYSEDSSFEDDDLVQLTPGTVLDDSFRETMRIQTVT